MHIAEVPPDRFIEDFGPEIAESWRMNGALAEWAQNSDDAKQAMTELNLHAFVIASVMGLEGWVIAKDVSVSVEN
jgi:hypothetical protein